MSDDNTEKEVTKTYALLAMEACVDIFKDYTKEEVERWATLSVQKAWAVGKELCNLQRKENKKKLKNFTL